MEPDRDRVDASIEVFADTCANLSRRDCDRVAVLSALGLDEERWSQVALAWWRRLTPTTEDARALALRFGRAFGAKAAFLLGGVAGAAPPQIVEADPRRSPPLLTPTFLLPPEPPPARARSESPWACTVPLESAPTRAALPFHVAETPPAVALGSGAPAQASAGTGTVALRDLVVRDVALDEDTERTVMAPPVVRARPVGRKSRAD